MATRKGRHGQWFARIFEKVIDECRPTSAEEFVDCVLQTQVAKNSLITEQGASPYQLVFGRNPRVPTDLLQEDPHVAASDAILMDSGSQRSNDIRQKARLAVLQCQDHRALGRRSVLDLGLAKIFSQGIGYITGGHRNGIKVI